jgi:hypothetical protein
VSSVFAILATFAFVVAVKLLSMWLLWLLLAAVVDEIIFMLFGHVLWKIMMVAKHPTFSELFELLLACLR